MKIRWMGLALVAAMLGGCAITPDSSGISEDGVGDVTALDATTDGGDEAPSQPDTTIDVVTDTVVDGGTADPLAPCRDRLSEQAAPFDVPPSGVLDGTIEFGQTHLIRSDETRLAPEVSAERDTLFLVTPEPALSEDVTVKVEARDGNGALLGVLPMLAPSSLPSPLEQDLTDEPLEPYSASAWHATLPWEWVRDGVTLTVGALEDGQLRTLTHTFEELGAPHRFTLTRTHMVLFGEPDFAIVPPQTASEVARDMAPWVPGAELRWVETSPWRLDRVVVNTADGPRWVASEQERLDVTSDGSRWNIIKHQGALRLSVANTGRGLWLTRPEQGDSSPYSFGTSMVQGWVRDTDGSYRDINNAGLAAGWTGWSGMWLNECGNGFIHEVGHSFTLEHFTAGTAQGWGIADEYPLDGEYLPDHPWGYDSLRRRMRTWYRVNRDGPVLENGERVGKRDPMNGGEAADVTSCYPPYTAYQMMRSQDWLQVSPTLARVDGVPGVYRWNPSVAAYDVETAPPGAAAPVAVDVPVVTVIGTLGNLDEVCQTYPAIASPSGNVFEPPSPADAALSEGFNGAQWFLEIHYGTGEVERALIRQGAIAPTDTGLYLYSLNLDAGRTPTRVDLYRSPSAYPAIDLEGAEWVHSRTIESDVIDAAFEGQILQVGRGAQANHEVRLTQWCEPGLNCAQRAQTATYGISDRQLSFAPASEGPGAASVCGDEGSFDVWSVPVIEKDGSEDVLIIHAQRVVTDGLRRVAVPASDTTPWIASPDLRQQLRVWIPYAENAQLAPGVYRTDGIFPVAVAYDGQVERQLALRIQLQVHSVDTVTLPPTYLSDGLAIGSQDPASSIYYVFDDASIGPTSGSWWGDATGTRISVPVIDQDTGDPRTLVLRAHKLACGSLWGINTGQAADWGCTHQVQLALEPGANGGLTPGQTYATAGSQPVVIRGLRWHEPSAGLELGVLALRIEHTP